MIYLQLFWEFFKTGLFSIGGGLATLPFLYDMSDRTAWFTHTQLSNMIAVSEATPGPIGVNMATYVGYELTGVSGAIVATLGLITPDVIVILIIIKVLARFRQNKYVEAAFYGLRPCSVGLIAAACYMSFKIAMLNTELFQKTGELLSLFNFKALALAALLLLLTRKLKYTKKLHPAFFIALSAAVGIIFKF